MKKNLLFEDILRTVSRYFVIIIIAVVLIICCSGIRFIKSGEQAIILRFGKIVGDTPDEQIHDAGVLFAFPYIIDEVITVPTGSIHEFTVNTHYTEGEMTTYDRNGYVITGDDNIAILVWVTFVGDADEFLEIAVRRFDLTDDDLVDLSLHKRRIFTQRMNDNGALLVGTDDGGANGVMKNLRVHKNLLAVNFMARNIYMK
jgi:hypothetical protein